MNETARGPEGFAEEKAEEAGFSVGEGVKIMTALARGQEANGGKGFSDHDLSVAISAVWRLKVNGVLAEMVLGGAMLMQVGNDGVVRYLTAPEFAPGDTAAGSGS